MSGLSIFYLIINFLLAVCACYSWFWQANIDFKGHYRYSSIVWALVFIWVGFSWDYLDKSDPGLTLCLALFVLISVFNGFSGLGPKRVVVSGYFKLTIRYSEIEMVRLVKIPNPKKDRVACIVMTKKHHRQYYLNFDRNINQVREILRKRLDTNTKIDVEDIMNY